MKRILPWLLAVAIIAGVAFWWDNGLQGWLSIQTGTAYCGHSPGAAQYCYHSGFGSVYPFALLAFGGIVTIVLTHWRGHTCHYAFWCWRRPSVPMDEGHPDVLLCRHHHPGHRPFNVKARVREAQRKTHMHLGKQPGKG